MEQTWSLQCSMEGGQMGQEMRWYPNSGDWCALHWGPLLLLPCWCMKTHFLLPFQTTHCRRSNFRLDGHCRKTNTCKWRVLPLVLIGILNMNATCNTFIKVCGSTRPVSSIVTVKVTDSATIQGYDLSGNSTNNLTYRFDSLDSKLTICVPAPDMIVI